jgi:hypothetical protein
MEMTELWKANIRLSKAPWKSRRRREIPTFPQLQRRVVLLERKRTQKEKTEGRLHKKLDTAGVGCGKAAPWKTTNQFSTPLGNPANPAGFPLSHNHDGGDHFPHVRINNKSISRRRFSLRHFSLARGI